MSLTRINIILAAIIVIPIVLAFIDWRPRVDNPLFDQEDMAWLNRGGVIDSDHPKLAGADEVCLFGWDVDRYEYRGCKIPSGPAIATIRNDLCTIYSLDGLEGRVLSQHEFECRSVASGFRMALVRRGKFDDLIMLGE